MKNVNSSIRVVMPIFQFDYDGAEFTFTDTYSLKHFDSKNEIPDNARIGLSEVDLSHLSKAKWAVVATNPNEDFKSELNLLLIALRIYAKSNAFIKWRLCKEDQKYSTCLDDRFRKLATVSNPKTTEESLKEVRDGFLIIMDMYNISDRTKNAFYFIWRGLCANKHVDAYIFLVCVIEALFSNENSEGVTNIVIKRTQKFLSGLKGYGGDQIKRIYKIRSDMVHGRISHTDKSNIEKRQKNINNLAKLEDLIFVCMRKMLQDKIYLKYATIKEKENFLDSLLV